MATTGEKVKELDFYEPFAEWLKNDLDEVTVVSSLGGAGLKSKWGTPDVVGVYKPLASDLIKFPKEIVSAEIKIDPQQPVVAFGQAVAYRLFSTKTYIAMPTTLTAEDQSRLESLCMLFGVGLALFDLNRRIPIFLSVYARNDSRQTCFMSMNLRTGLSHMMLKYLSNYFLDAADLKKAKGHWRSHETRGPTGRFPSRSKRERAAFRRWSSG